MKVDRIVANQAKLPLRIPKGYFRDERIVLITQVFLPLGAVNPGEAAIAPNSHPERVALGLILLADMRKVEVPQAIRRIKGDQHATVADGNVSWHSNPPSFRSLALH